MARGQAVGSMVFNKPQLIALDQAQPIINYLSAPDRATTLHLGKSEKEDDVILQLADFDAEDDYRRYTLARNGINPDTMVGVLDVSGALMYRKGSMGADCTELTSYEGLKEQAQSQIDAGVNTIVLMVDSGGGMAYGMFSAAEYIKKISKQAGVKTVAYVDGVSYSAAYGLSVLADEIIVNPQASVGSIGVVVALYNDSKALEDAGYTRQFIYAGENKIPFDAKGEFSKQFLDDLQKSVDKTYSSFTKHVSSNRGISEQSVIDTQASVYDADEAMSLGLVDKIMELEDFEIEYGLKVSKNSGTNSNSMAADTSQSSKEVTMSQKKENEKAVVAGDNVPAATNEDLKGSEGMAEELSQLQTKYESLDNDYKGVVEELNTTKTQLKELQDSVAATELTQRTDTRKAMLEAALGKDNEDVEKMLVSTESLSDEHFGNIAQGLLATTEARQAQLAEVGGEGDTSEVQLDLSQQLKQMAATMYGRKA